MRELEFLPAWYPQSRRRHRLVLLQGWATVALITGMGLYLGLAERNIRSNEKSLAALNSQLAQTEAQLAEVDRYTEWQKQLRQQDQILARMGVYVPASALMHTLDAAMGKQMSLTALALDTDERTEAPQAKGAEHAERRLKVRLTGVAPTDVDLANFMTQLSSVPFFEQVNITYAKEKSDNGHLMREFEVTFSLNLTSQGS